MSEKRIGIIMHGVTGRMGMNQHLIRSILEIRKQGGVALKDGTRVMPDPILVGRNAAKIEELAKKHGVERWTTDLDQALQSKDEIFFDAASTQLRPKLLKQAIAAGKHVYCEKPVSMTLAEAKDLYAAAKKARVKHGVVQDKLWLPGLLKLQKLRRGGLLRPDPLRPRRVRLLGFRRRPGARTTRRAAPVVELPQAGRRRHHPRHAVPLALRARQPVRRGEGGELPRRHAHFAPLGRERQEVQGHRGRRRLRHLPACRRHRGALQFLLGRARAARRPAHAAGRRHAKAARWPVCESVWCKATTETPKPVWNPDIPQPIDFFQGWEPVPDENTDNAFKVQWELFLKHVAGEERKFRWNLLEGAKGVQLAELGMKSWKQQKVAGRAEAQPMKRDRILTIKLPTPGALEEFAIHEPRQFQRPKKPFTRKALAAAHVVADPLLGEGALARRRDRLGCDAGLPPPPLVVGLRRGRGDGHRAARHGARLDQFARAGAPLDPGRRQGRCGGERRGHRPSPGRKDVLDRGNHRRLRRAMRGDREARRPHHPDGEPRARRFGEVTRGLRTRLRPHPGAGEGAGDHPLAGRDVRSGAGGVLGEEGSPRRHGGLPFGFAEERVQGGRHQDLAARQGQRDRHAPQAAARACACTPATTSTSPS